MHAVCIFMTWMETDIFSLFFWCLLWPVLSLFPINYEVINFGKIFARIFFLENFFFTNSDFSCEVKGIFFIKFFFFVKD